MSYWRGKRAVIIGGSAGLGRALVGVLVERGAKVAISARTESTLNLAADELRAQGGDVIAIPADVTKTHDIGRLADVVQHAWGGVDMLCHCAGRSMRGGALETPAETYRELWDINFLSAVRCTQAFAAALRQSGGHIVLVGSLASKVAPRYLGAYPASKFPLAAFAQQLRLENGQQGPHVLLVCPGPIAREGDETAGGRYADQAAGLPASAREAGGGAKVRAIEPQWLAKQILGACEKRRAELVVPARARLLFAISQISPRLGDWLLRKNTSG